MRALKVLIVDDVRLELEIESTFFQRSGFQVLAAKNGHEALALALANSPDLVIVDQIMPGLSGTDVCRALKMREETRRVPVIITSVTDRQDIRELCLQAGAEAFVPKSSGREALLRAAAAILHVPERRMIRLTVFFLTQEIVGAKESLGKGIDLSEGGIGLETTRRHTPGSTISMRFMLPGERHEHRATGRIASVAERSNGTCLLGVEFSSMSARDRKRLNQYLDKTLCVAT